MEEITSHALYLFPDLVIEDGNPDDLIETASDRSIAIKKIKDLFPDLFPHLNITYQTSLKEIAVKEEALREFLKGGTCTRSRWNIWNKEQDDDRLPRKALEMFSGLEETTNVYVLFGLAQQQKEVGIEIMVTSGDWWINAADPTDGTALQYAAAAGDLGAVQLLLSLGAHVNATDGKSAQSPLHMAAGAGHLKVVNALLEYGADVNLKDKEGFTPFRKPKDEDIKKILDT